MPNTIIGKVLLIGQTVDIPTKSGNQFRKRELVLDASTYDQFTGQKRENYPSLSFLQNRTEELNRFHEGDMVIVSFFISGRRWEKDGEVKYFNDIVGYRIEPFVPNQGSQPSQSAAPYQPPTQAQTASPQGSNAAPQASAEPFPPAADANGNTDDLPF